LIISAEKLQNSHASLEGSWIASEGQNELAFRAIELG